MGRYDHLIGHELVRGQWSWNPDRAMLYAVGVGAGLDDPLNELQFTTENSPGIAQQVIPTFLTLMGLPSDYLELLGWEGQDGHTVGMVHGEQSITLDRAIPCSGTVDLSTVISGVYDKGTAALLVKETAIRMADTGEPLGTACIKLFVQGKGGFGGPRRPPDETAWAEPETPPDVVVTLPVGLNQSLIYRLSGDHTLHGTDPAAARGDGFDRPIFYGLGSFGVACRALLRGLCDGDTARFGHMEARFSKPVHPGDSLETRIWRTADGAHFQMLANGERLALDRGIFRFR